MVLGVLIVAIVGVGAFIWSNGQRQDEPTVGPPPAETPAEVPDDEPSSDHPEDEPVDDPRSEPAPEPAEGAPIEVVGTSRFQSSMEALRVVAPDLPYTVSPIGQGAGVEDFANGAGHVLMAMPGLTGEQDARGSAACVDNTHHFLATAQLLFVVANLPGIERVVLDGPAMTGIYGGTIVRWNDPALAELNPGSALPDLPITPVFRGDESGTNRTMQRWLVATADWPGDETQWLGEYGEPAQGSSGVTSTVQGTAGAIGYISWYGLQGLTVADIATPDGDVVSPAPEFLDGHLERAMEDPSAGSDPLAPGSYPLVDFGYLVTCLEYADPAVGTSVRELVVAALSKEGQEIFASESGIGLTHPGQQELAEEIR